MIEADHAWKNGSLVPFADCRTHDSAFTLHYGLGIFEGIRCYRRDDGRSAIFRLREHVRRLYQSAAICNIAIPHTPAEIEAACREVVRANGFAEAYIRPLVVRGAGSLGIGSTDNPVDTLVMCWQWKPMLGEAGIRDGIRALVSSFVRGHTNNVMSKGKIVGQYVTSVLAKQEAARLGHEDAIMLDGEGRVVEATAENIFIVRDGRLFTPPLDMAILAGITRDAVIQLARDDRLAVEERAFTRDALYTADEVFLTGTATEVTPVREIDGRRIGDGKPGALTRRLQEAFYAAVRGPGEPRPEWLAYV